MIVGKGGATMQVPFPELDPCALRAIAAALNAAAEQRHQVQSGFPPRLVFAAESPDTGRHRYQSCSADDKYPMRALADTARRIVQQRRKRDEVLGMPVSSEPLWDMLLDLFINRVEGRRVAVSSLCLASAVPDTTALRYIDVLEQNGALTREQDPMDKRRFLLELTPAYFLKMAELLNQTLQAPQAPHFPDYRAGCGL